MKRTALSFLIFYFGLRCLCCAQNSYNIALGIAENFSPSVIVRLQDVTSKMNLSKDRQILFASYFVKADSLLSSSILKGASDTELGKLRVSLQNEFRTLLSPTEQQLYYTKAAYQQATEESRASTTFYSQNIGNDQKALRLLNGLYLDQRVALNRIYLQYQGTDSLQNQLMTAMASFDTLQDIIYSVAKGNIFFKEKINFLNAIKPLSTKDSATLNYFFSKACAQTSIRSYADNFMEAMHKVIKDTIYYSAIYRTEIEYQTKYNTSKALYDLTKSYHLTLDANYKIRSLVQGRERTAAVIRYAFPIYSRYADSLSNRSKEYYDSLITVALLRDGSFPNVSQFSIALKNREKLALSQTQIDTLFGKAVGLEKRRDEFYVENPLGKFDGSAFEAENISKILSEDQYLVLLNIKNKPQAEAWAKGDWEELKNRGMAEGLDSTSVIYQITLYNTNRLTTIDRYANDKIKQNAQIKAIDSAMPAALRRLKNARNTANTAVNKQSSVKSSLRW